MHLDFVRADTFLRRGTGDVSMIEESQNLSLFLANQNKITLLLKEGLETIDGYDDVLADVLTLCVRLHESNMYITPHEKHVLVKVCCLSLLRAATIHFSMIRYIYIDTRAMIR